MGGGLGGGVGWILGGVGWLGGVLGGWALVFWVVVLGVGLVLRLGGRWGCLVSGWVLGCVSGGGVLVFFCSF